MNAESFQMPFGVYEDVNISFLLRSIAMMSYIRIFPNIEQSVDSGNKPHLVIMQCAVRLG